MNTPVNTLVDKLVNTLVSTLVNTLVNTLVETASTRRPGLLRVTDYGIFYLFRPFFLWSPTQMVSTPWSCIPFRGKNYIVPPLFCSSHVEGLDCIDGDNLEDY